MQVRNLTGEYLPTEIPGLFERAAELVVITIIYVVVAKLSLVLASLHPNATPIWPVAGFGLACLRLRGYRVAPALFVASFLVNAGTALSIVTALAIAAGNTLEAVITSLIVDEWARGKTAFDRPVDVAKVTVCCFAPGAALSATIGLASLHLAGQVDASAFRGVWTTWWLGDSAGMLVVAPALVLWGRNWRQLQDSSEALRSGVLYAATIFVGLIAFSPLFEQTASRTALAFLAIVPLMWAAVRRNPRDTATVALLLSAFAVWGTMMHGGPFLRRDVNESFLLLLAFMIAATAPSLALSAEVVEQKRQKDQVDFVLRELSHRSKNLLAVVQSMASQVARRSSDFESFYAGYAARLQALADVHDSLVAGDWRGADIRDLARKQMRPFTDGAESSIIVEGPSLVLNPQAAEQIGLALHELGTNAVKHGALSVEVGSVEIRWDIERGEHGESLFRLDWQEAGGPRISRPERVGFGHVLLTRVVPETLRGRATLDFNPEGLRFALLAPTRYVLPIVKGVTAMAIERTADASARSYAQQRVRRAHDRRTAAAASGAFVHNQTNSESRAAHFDARNGV